MRPATRRAGAHGITFVTAAQLLGLISAALLVQLAVGIGVVLRRRRLAARTAPAEIPATRSKPHVAWEGWREFKVVQRSLEDAARTQCSFHIQPVDGRPLPDFRPGQFLTFSLDVAGGSMRRGRSRGATRSPIDRTPCTTA